MKCRDIRRTKYCSIFQVVEPASDHGHPEQGREVLGELLVPYHHAADLLHFDAGRPMWTTRVRSRALRV